MPSSESVVELLTGPFAADVVELRAAAQAMYDALARADADQRPCGSDADYAAAEAFIDLAEPNFICALIVLVDNWEGSIPAARAAAAVTEDGSKFEARLDLLRTCATAAAAALEGAVLHDGELVPTDEQRAVHRLYVKACSPVVVLRLIDYFDMAVSDVKGA